MRRAGRSAFNKLVDPAPSYHAVPSVSVSQSHVVIQGATPDEVRRAVDNALRRQKREPSSPAEDPTLIFCVLAFGGVIYLLIHYGILVVDVIRWFTFLTGFSAAFSLFRGYRTRLFQERQWIVRTIVILIVCGLSYVSASITRDNIETILAMYRIELTGLRDFVKFFKVFRLQGIYYVVALLLCFGLSILSLLAQINMVLSAHLARDMSRNWRMTLLRGMGDWWASGRSLAFMLFFAILALACASGLWARLFSS